MNWTAIGAISAFLAVAAGAFGAHALRQHLEPRMLEVFETGVRYHMFHALALISVGILGNANSAGWCFACGTLLFSGSLYALSMTGARWLGPITPLGGLLFLTGWVLVARAALTGPA